MDLSEYNQCLENAQAAGISPQACEAFSGGFSTAIIDNSYVDSVIQNSNQLFNDAGGVSLIVPVVTAALLSRVFRH